MNPLFALDHARLAAEPHFAALASALGGRREIHSPESFNGYCREACRRWRDQAVHGALAPSAAFDGLLARIEAHEPATIHTGWGGVVVTRHEPPQVDKYLVVRRGGYLALEKHAEKDEHLEILEGAGLLLSRQSADGALRAEGLLPGGRFHFAPGQEHCIVGLDHLLVSERGTDPKGMDQDLIFLYEPDNQPND